MLHLLNTTTTTYYTHSINGARTATGTVVEIRGASLLVVNHDGCNHVVRVADLVRCSTPHPQTPSTEGVFRLAAHDPL